MGLSSGLVLGGRDFQETFSWGEKKKALIIVFLGHTQQSCFVFKCLLQLHLYDQHQILGCVELTGMAFAHTCFSIRSRGTELLKISQPC